MPNLTPDQQKRLDEGLYYTRLKHEKRLYADVLEMLGDFAESALAELSAYSGGDKEVAFHLLRQYQARLDFKHFFEMRVQQNADEIERLCEELGVNYADIRVMSEINP